MTKYLEIKINSTNSKAIYINVIRETPKYFIIKEYPRIQISAKFYLKPKTGEGIVQIHKFDNTKRENIILIRSHDELPDDVSSELIFD